MVVPSIVLVDRSRQPASTARLTHIARAFQTQVDRDLSPMWGATADVGAAAEIPTASETWSLVIVEDAAATLGVRLDPIGQPCAQVRAGAHWTRAASHALMEMITNPGGQRFMRGLEIASGPEQRSVRYLVEVCDPCAVFHYEIDGVEVSDFVTPDYYRADAAAGTAIDFLRRLRRPLEVPPGCCLSWQDPEDGHWHRRSPDGTVAKSHVPIDADRNPREDLARAFRAGASVG